MPALALGRPPPRHTDPGKRAPRPVNASILSLGRQGGFSFPPAGPSPAEGQRLCPLPL